MGYASQHSVKSIRFLCFSELFFGMAAMEAVPMQVDSNEAEQAQTKQECVEEAATTKVSEQVLDEQVVVEDAVSEKSGAPEAAVDTSAEKMSEEITGEQAVIDDFALDATVDAGAQNMGEDI